MTAIFAAVVVFVLASAYAVLITALPAGREFAEQEPLLAFTLGELMIIGVVALGLGTVDAQQLFLLNAAGALPMLMRKAVIDAEVKRAAKQRREFDAETEKVARGR